MRQFSIFLFLLCFLNSFGQFAIVNETDSFLNVRKEGLKNSEVIDKLKNGQLIYCFENKGNWTNIDYTKNGKELNGYIYKDRFKFVSEFTPLIISNETETSVTLKKDSIEVTITQSKFDKKKHKFKYVKQYSDQITLIDNKKYRGTDGEMPTTQFEKIEIKIGSKTIVLPENALDGLYQPGIYNAKVNYDKTTDILYIQTMNSDGAGAYFVIWKVVKGIYEDRLIPNSF